MKLNGDLLERVAAALHADRWVRDQADRISLRLVDGHVVLDGGIDDISSKRRAVALADLLSEGRIIDQLRRKATEQIGDGELVHRASKRLAEEGAFLEYGLGVMKNGRLDVHRKPRCNPKNYQIVVSADNAAVTLAGKVGSLSHRRLAEALLWWLDGCEHVCNELVVEPAQQDSDNELNDAVQIVLEKDPLIDASQLHVGTAAGIVQIEGALSDASHRRRVLQDVWIVPGVWDVDDRMQTFG